MVRCEAEGRDGVGEARELWRREACVVAGVVELGEASEAGEDEGGTVKGWEEVLVGQGAEGC